MYAKHRITVYPMTDAYVTFDSEWKVEGRGQAASQPQNTRATSRNSKLSAPSLTSKVKRRMRDRDSHSPDANDEKRRKTSSPKAADGGQGRLYACCFHKYNARKYCSNSDTGTKYRSCAGPGFSTISKLK